MEENLFEVFPLEATNQRFFTEDLQERVKTEIRIYATDVNTLNYKKFTKNSRRLEEIFGCRIEKMGMLSELKDPRKRGKVVFGGRVKLKQIEGFLWHWTNHNQEDPKLIDKWKESFLSDLKSSIEENLDKARRELQRVGDTEITKAEGEREYVLFSKYVEGIYQGMVGWSREMLGQMRDQQFLENRIDNLKNFVDDSIRFWIENKQKEKNEIETICSDILTSFHTETETDKWGGFLGKEGTFIPKVLEVGEEIEEDYYSYLIVNNLLEPLTQFLSDNVNNLRRSLVEEQERAKGLAENLKDKMDHELRLNTLIDDYKKSNLEMTKELTKNKNILGEQNIKMIELKFQSENFEREVESLKKELDFKQRENGFELEKRNRDIIEKDRKIEEMIGNLQSRNKEYQELMENTMNNPEGDRKEFLLKKSILKEEKAEAGKELTDNIWETYKRTGEMFGKVEKLVEQFEGKFEKSRAQIFKGVDNSSMEKYTEMIKDLLDKKQINIDSIENTLIEKDQSLEKLRNEMKEIQKEERSLNSKEDQSSSGKGNVNSTHKVLKDKIKNKEKVIDALNGTMKKMLEHIKEFYSEKSKLTSEIKQFQCLLENLELIMNKFWKDEEKSLKYSENWKEFGVIKKKILKYFYKKCKKTGIFG